MVKLSGIHSPNDLKGRSEAELEALAKQLRKAVIRTVAENGGHLASNLGVVEITLALHAVFDVPRDKLVFDVGHQCYAHKLLTGRAERFGSLRKYGGLSGFPRREENAADAFNTGHASTAISAALGMARARDALGEKHHVVALVGDGAMTGGMCYEALNDAGNTKTRLIVVLNDNDMSISRNVGALANYLSKLRTSAGYLRTKRSVKRRLTRLPVVGLPILHALDRAKEFVKRSLVGEGFFEALGFTFLGPIDGHSLPALIDMFERAKTLDEPVLIHCVTQKGHGYAQAEEQPEHFHGTPPFFVDSGDVRKIQHQRSYGEIAAETLASLARDDARIRAVTAAMRYGTALMRFEEAFPDRVMDVGIAEEHAVTLCAGLAVGGMRPYFFVYSTFMQRGFDQALEDVCFQDLPVVFMIDRAGLACEDGTTHHGLYDIAYLRLMPNIVLLSPMDGREMAAMVRFSHGCAHPCAIRYPRISVDLSEFAVTSEFCFGRWQRLKVGADAALLATGTMVKTALRVRQALAAEGVQVSVYNASTIKPLDEACLRALAETGKPLFTMEEHAVRGGFGGAVLEFYALNGLRPAVIPIGTPDAAIPHGSRRELMNELGLSTKWVTRRVLTALKGGGQGGVGGHECEQ